MFSREHRVAIGIPGEFVSELDDIWALSTTTANFSSSMSWRGPVQPFLLNKSVADELVDGPFGFYSLINRQPSARTEMEELLLTALHWVGDSAIQAKPANQLLSLFIALETMLTQGHGGITRDLSEAMAFLLEEEVEGRRWVRDNVKALYEGRGDVAHRGSLVVAPDEISWLTNTTLGVLQRILLRREEFPTRRALAEWLDTQRLS
jgi:hypothetical protein